MSTGKLSSTGADQLAALLAEALGDHPERKAEFRTAKGVHRSGDMRSLLWWKSPGGNTDEMPLWIGLTELDRRVLANAAQSGGASLSGADEAICDLFERAFGRSGRIVSDGPDHTEFETIESRFPTGETARLLIASDDAASTGAFSLDVLMDIELPITLRFGSTQMALQDIVGLNTGSVIEFDRALTEPIEVMVNGCVVARGEVVTVGGVYGVRVSEIASRKARLDSSAVPAGVLSRAGDRQNNGAGEAR